MGKFFFGPMLFVSFLIGYYRVIATQDPSTISHESPSLTPTAIPSFHIVHPDEKEISFDCTFILSNVTAHALEESANQALENTVSDAVELNNDQIDCWVGGKEIDSDQFSAIVRITASTADYTDTSVSHDPNVLYQKIKDAIDSTIIESHEFIDTLLDEAYVLEAKSLMNIHSVTATYGEYRILPLSLASEL